MSAAVYLLAAVGMVVLCIVVPIALIAVIDLWTASKDRKP